MRNSRLPSVLNNIHIHTTVQIDNEFVGKRFVYQINNDSNSKGDVLKNDVGMDNYSVKGYSFMRV